MNPLEIPGPRLRRMGETRPVPGEAAALEGWLHSRRLVLLKTLLTRAERAPAPRPGGPRPACALDAAGGRRATRPRRGAPRPRLPGGRELAGARARRTARGGLRGGRRRPGRARRRRRPRSRSRLPARPAGVRRTAPPSRTRRVSVRGAPGAGRRTRRHRHLRPAGRGAELPDARRPAAPRGAAGRPLASAEPAARRPRRPGRRRDPHLAREEGRAGLAGLLPTTVTAPGEAREWRELWTRALALLRDADPERATEVAALVRTVVPPSGGSPTGGPAPPGWQRPGRC